MKKRSSIVVMIVLAVLVGFSIYVYKNKKKSGTIDEDLRNFSYKDTAAITKIFIADKEGDQSTIVRTKTGWVVNDKYPCRPDAILNLLEVIKNIEVKMPVSKNARDGVLKYMTSVSQKVEIYVGDKRVKQYYVGHETPDSEGSYMLLSDPETGENHKDPFICFIPGFNGFLNPRYIAKENEWRNRVVMNYTPPQMKQVKVNYPAQPDSSFTIEILNTNTFKLKNGKGEEIPYDVNKIKQYLAYYQNLSYEALFTGKNMMKLRDSLVQQKPFGVITVVSNNFKSEDYKFFYKQPTRLVPEHGIEYKYDPDRLFMRFANDKEWAIIQYFVFGKLLITNNYFSPSGTAITVKK
ncbi:MAG: hypothetical protein K0S32_1249 [Bacteroidetes bacterium]|nr:hypothetical protein [Bacteroidota bacterium]